jgi:mono/diheme cytochrome c family protein
MRTQALRWGAIAVALLLVTAALVLAALGYRLSQEQIRARNAIVPDYAHADIARGEHLVSAVTSCTSCHGARLEGKAFINNVLIGRVDAPNLTTGAGGFFKSHTDEEFVQAVRFGRSARGNSLLFMPSAAYERLTQKDLGDILAYVRAAIPQASVTLPTRLGPLGYGLLAIGAVPRSSNPFHANQTNAAHVERDGSRAYGGYLVRVGGCMECHGADLKGGHYRGTFTDPRAPNLTKGGPTGAWTFGQFKTSVRSGVRPDGKAINSFMPWATIGQMSDDELRAIWSYLR